jgi:carboxymethylenebutenolidase
VVVLHGANGLVPAHYHFARTLAKQGYVALVINYYAETGAVAREEVIRMLKQWSTWERTVQHSVQYLQASPDVQPDHIGIVGFSRGASLALSTAGITPAVKAVVAYYGGALPSLGGYVQNLPPVLLLHGDADSRAPVAYSQAVYEALVRHGKPVEMFMYPGVEHGFNVTGAWYDPPADADAQKRTLMFLDKYLKLSEAAG